MENLPARTSGAGPLADYSIGMRVQTREGYPGVITDIHEGPADLTTYWVTLDNDMGGGEYAEAEIWPLAAQQTASQMASEAGVERTAADDYPVLDEILGQRLPPVIVQSEIGPTLVRQDVADGLSGDTELFGHGGLLSSTASRLGSDGDDETISATDVAARLALYLPPKPPGEQAASTTPLTPDQKQGYDEGFRDGKEGLTRQPSLPGDADYMAGYEIGWAEGVTVNRQPPDLQSNYDLEQNQIAGTYPDALGPMRASRDEVVPDHLVLYRGEGSHDHPSYYPKGSTETGGWWTTDLASAQRYAQSAESGRVYKVEVAAHEVDPQGLPGYYFIPDPAVRERRTLYTEASVVDLPMPHVPTPHEAGAFLDWISGNPRHTDNWHGVGTGHSRDWCRFRRDSHCWLSKDLNEEASKEAGYAVWNPVDRGYCYRVKWDDQMRCPVGAPGPNVPGGFTDATTPWEQGGQRGGQPTDMFTNPFGPGGTTGAKAAEISGRRITRMLDSYTSHKASLHTAVFVDGPAYGEYATEHPGSRIYGDRRAAIWYSEGAIGDPGGVTIHAVQVEPEFQRQGLASQLLDWMAEQFRGHFVDPGGLTPEGAKLWPAWYRSRNWARPRLPGAPHTNYILLQHPDEITNPNLKGSLITSSLHTAAEPQWLINGKPYSDGVWIEVEPDLWYRGSAPGEIPSRLVVKRDGDRWRWEARVSTFIGAPHEDTGWQKPGAPSGVAKTLEAAQEKAQASLAKDHEFFRQYQEKQRIRLQNTTAAAEAAAVSVPAMPRPSEPRRAAPSLNQTGANGISAEASFEITATWADVRAKAKRIRQGGGVRFVASKDNELVAHVKGDNGVYETWLIRNPGRKNAAAWHCGCKWASYAWGRSPLYKRFEGRMCSHALAMQYEAQSRNMFGRELTLDEKQPSWMDGVHVHRPTDYRRDLKRYTMLHSATEEYWSQHRPNPEGPTVDDLTAGGLVPDDVYERPDLYTGYVGEPCYAETLRVLKAVRGNPGASVTIYRALPPGHTSISNGDWVSLSESYARQHAIQDDDPAHDWPIISASVPAHTVRYAGDDLMEYGYFGSPVTGRISSLQTDAGMFDWIPEAMVNHEIGEHLHPVDESYDPERDGDDLSPVAAMVKQATQCVCPICSDIMTSQVAGMSCMRCGTLVPYVSTEDLFVTFDEGEPVMERAGDTLKERYAGYYTEQDLIESWEASPEAQSGMTAEEALHALYAEQDPDLFPGLLKAKASATSFYARVRGVVRRVLLDDDGPKLDGRERVPAAEVLYPKWHPSKGLSPNDNSAFVAALGMRFRPSRTLPYPDKPNQATPRPVSNEGYLAKKKDQTVSPSEHGDPRLQDAGVTVSKTEDGKYYVHTHRARGKDRDSVADIPDSEIEFISSTGAKKPEAPEVSGVALLAADTGRVLMLQRSIDDKTAGGKWEFPGGHHEDGDLTSLHAAIREWQEEVGQPFPEGGYVAHTWTSPNGIYQGHVVVIPKEKGLVLHEGRVMENPDDPDSEWCEQVAWWDPLDAKKNPALREECKDSPWAEMIKAVAKKAAALIKQADEDQCPRCGEDYPGTVDLGKGWYGCPDCQISFTGPGDNVTIVPFGDLPEVSYDHPNYPSFVPAHD